MPSVAVVGVKALPLVSNTTGRVVAQHGSSSPVSDRAGLRRGCHGTKATVNVARTAYDRTPRASSATIAYWQ